MDKKELKREIWRLRLNCLFTWLTTPLFAISQIGTSSSFHQFVTNPTKEELQNKTAISELEPGLGESELFYSLLIALFEFGSIVGGLLSGVFVRCVPYWYLWAVALLSHIVGYVIYSVASQAWLIVLSRLLAGYLIGVIVTIAYLYMAKASEEYVAVQKRLGVQTSFDYERNIRFASLTFGYSIGSIVGPGMAVIFAQFDSLNQFRAIGWFNVGYGVAVFGLLVLIFRGEMQWKTIKRANLSSCKLGNHLSSCKLGLLPLFIIVSLLALSFTERLRFGVLQTLLNPIASDSFGIDERYAAYFFLGFGFVHLCGSITLYVLQRCRVSNQSIVLLAIFITVAGFLIFTDWQTLPYDPCTEYSPFHHPELITDRNATFHYPKLPKSGRLNSTVFKSTDFRHLSATLTSEMQINWLIDQPLQFGSKFEFDCEYVENCDCNNQAWPKSCFPLVIGHTTSPNDLFLSAQVKYNCSSKTNIPITLCIDHVETLYHRQPVTIEPATVGMEINYIADIQSIKVLQRDVYMIAKSSCIEANVTGHQCHWIPSSDINKKECVDCQPICRDVHQTLTVAQFIVGNGMLVIANSLQMSPMVALIMNQSPEQIQGIVVGLFSATNAVVRTVSPMILDAAYEGVQKRTFLFALVLALLNIPFMIEIILLYQKLGPTKEEPAAGSSKHGDSEEKSLLE